MVPLSSVRRFSRIFPMTEMTSTIVVKVMVVLRCNLTRGIIMSLVFYLLMSLYLRFCVNVFLRTLFETKLGP